MSHVVAEPCFDCKYTDSVVVCPVEAIFYEVNLPEQWKDTPRSTLRWLRKIPISQTNMRPGKVRSARAGRSKRGVGFAFLCGAWERGSRKDTEGGTTRWS